MALDKLVDSTQLDSDLTSVANAIRTKGGTSAQLAFPAGFVSAINDISGGGPTPEVPTGYTQLKYLESSGTQIINTDFAPTLETKMQLQAFILEGNGSYYPMAGCNNPPLNVGSLSSVGSNAAFNSFGNVTDKQITNPAAWCDSAPIFTINKTEAKIEIDSVITKTVSLNATTMSGNASTRIALFGRNNAGVNERLSKTRMYRAKIWDNGTLVRDFVPALRNADDVIGMYDIVNNVFYTNAGTGVFTGGTY